MSTSKKQSPVLIRQKKPVDLLHTELCLQAESPDASGDFFVHYGIFIHMKDGIFIHVKVLSRFQGGILLKFSIKFKFILVCCILLIVPSAIVGGVGYTLSRQGLHEQMVANLQNSVTMAIELIRTQQELVDGGRR